MNLPPLASRNISAIIATVRPWPVPNTCNVSSEVTASVYNLRKYEMLGFNVTFHSKEPP